MKNCIYKNKDCYVGVVYSVVNGYLRGTNNFFAKIRYLGLVFVYL